MNDKYLHENGEEYCILGVEYPHINKDGTIKERSHINKEGYLTFKEEVKE